MVLKVDSAVRFSQVVGIGIGVGMGQDQISGLCRALVVCSYYCCNYLTRQKTKPSRDNLREFL